MNQKLNQLLEKQKNQYISKTKKSYEMQKISEKYMPGGSTRTTQWMEPYPFYADNAHGSIMTDIDGNNYLDFMINATSLILGHSSEEVKNVLNTQIQKGTAYSAPTEGQAKLAKLITDRTRSMETLRFTNSGTEATMMAIMAARAYTQKHKIAKFEGGYHGTHDHVSISVSPKAEDLKESTHPGILQYPGQPESLLNDVIVLPFNDIEKSKELINAHREDLACLIMEPVISGLGYLPLKQNFLQFTRDITNELDIVLIYDEIQSYRLAPGGAQEIFGITPDLTSLGKIIGGGLPVGAFGGKEEIMETLNPSSNNYKLSHAGTFNGNPLTMEAGAAVMSTLTKDKYTNMNSMGDSLRIKLNSIFDELEIDSQITGIGSLFGINFNSNKIKDYRSFINNNNLLTKVLFMGLLNNGVLMQTKNAGALNIKTTENDLNKLVGLVRDISTEIKSNL